MPEGPEVRVVADFISEFNSVVFGSASVVENTDKLHRFSHNPPEGFDSIRNGFILDGVITKGKLIAIEMSTQTSGIKYALVTLGMSGSWVRNGLEHKHARLSFRYPDGDLTFVDPRCFGTFKLVDRAELDKKLRSVGHDLLNDPMDAAAWLSLKSHKHIRDLEIGEALMEQRLFSGIGNIYKSEVLYQCSIDPRMHVCEISDEIWSSVNACAHEILRSSYLNKGSTISTFSSDGHHGNNQFSLRVYGKKLAPEGEVVSFDQAGRTTWWCPARVKHQREERCQLSS